MAFQKRVVTDLKWREKGDGVDGHLVAIKRVNFEGKPQLLFHVRTKDGALVRFFGTSLLNDMIHPADLGSMMKITVVGQKENTGNRNPTWLFEVLVDPEDRIAVEMAPAASAGGPQEREQPPLEDYDVA